METLIDWLRHLWRRRSLGSEINDEIRFHLDRRIEEFRRDGMTRREARAAAGLRFGDVGAVERACRTANNVSPITRKDSLVGDLSQDLRLSLRMLIRNPAFAAVAILTLALGIGANSAVFTALNSVLLSPLPYDEPQQLVSVYTGWTQDPQYRGPVASADFLDYREGIAGFEQIAAIYSYREEGLDLMGPSGPMRIRALPVSSGYFETFRATPYLGRTFRREEETSDSRLVILSHTFWKTVVNADRDIVGQSLTLNDESYTVVGIMKPTFYDVNTGDVDLWIPQNLEPGNFNSRDNLYLAAIARLRAGVTPEQAQAQLDALHATLVEQYPQSDSWKIPWLVPMFDDVVRQSGTMLYVLMGASALVLLIACVNVANLSLARGLSRRKELGIRLALGSGRGRLTRQLLTEGTVITVLGGGLGLLLAFGGMKGLLAMSPESLARAEEVGFDFTLLLFTAIVTLGTGAILGVAPAIGVNEHTAHTALRESSRGASSSRRSRIVRGALVTGQVSLAVTLLVGAGVLMRSFVNLQGVETGYEPRRVYTYEVHLPEARYGEAEARIQFHKTLHDRLNVLPGVRTTGAVSWLPVNGVYHQWGLRREDTNGEDGFAIQVRVTEGDYFGTMNIPVIAGRDFDERDRLDTEAAALLNATAARLAFGEESPLNQQVRVGGRTWTVVGVVGDVAHTAQGDIGPKIYMSHSQYGDNRNWAMIQVVGTQAEVDVASAVRSELARIDPQLVVYRPRQMIDVAARQIARERFAFTLMTVFAGISLVLAAVGLYGVLSYSVTQRFHELGIRLALGARSAQVLRIVAGQAIVLTGIGMAAGLTAAALLGRFIQSLTFNVSVADPLTFGAVAGVIAVVATVSVIIPARRAITADPVDVLRSE